MKTINHPLKTVMAAQPKASDGPKRPLTVMGNEIGDAQVGKPVELCVYANVTGKMKDGTVLLDITKVEPTEDSGDAEDTSKPPIVRTTTEPAP